MGELSPAVDSEGRSAWRLSAAGDAFNAAVHFKREAPDAQAALAGAVGTDPVSEAILAAAEGHGLDASTLLRRPGETAGLYMIETDEAGERRFTYWRSTSAARRWLRDPAAARALEGADLVHLTGITLAVQEDDAARAGLLDLVSGAGGRGARVSFDGNFRPALWASAEDARAWSARALAVADVALMTWDDERALWGDASERDALDRLAAAGPAEVVLKLGERGALARHDGETHAVPAAPAPRVVDTTGAGDAFDAGYLAARRSGPPVEAALAGARLAARIVGLPGAIPDAIPDA